MSEDTHPLDKALGDIHEIAIMLYVLYGLNDTARHLTEAHEKIQNYLIEHEK